MKYQEVTEAARKLCTYHGSEWICNCDEVAAALVDSFGDGVEATHDADLHALIRLQAERDAALARAEAAERERDLAIAHDRQPYPTVWAYEQSCKALAVARERVLTLETALKQCSTWSLMITPSEIQRIARDALATLDHKS